MKHLEKVFAELPAAEQIQIEKHARKRGCSRLEFLGELLEKDMAKQSAAIRRASSDYRFAKDEDFGVKTFMEWLKHRRSE